MNDQPWIFVDDLPAPDRTPADLWDLVRRWADAHHGVDVTVGWVRVEYDDLPEPIRDALWPAGRPCVEIDCPPVDEIRLGPDPQ